VPVNRSFSFFTLNRDCFETVGLFCSSTPLRIREPTSELPPPPFRSVLSRRDALIFFLCTFICPFPPLLQIAQNSPVSFFPPRLPSFFFLGELSKPCNFPLPRSQFVRLFGPSCPTLYFLGVSDKASWSSFCMAGPSFFPPSDPHFHPIVRPIFAPGGCFEVVPFNTFSS